MDESAQVEDQTRVKALFSTRVNYSFNLQCKVDTLQVSNEKERVTFPLCNLFGNAIVVVALQFTKLLRESCKEVRLDQDSC